MSGSNQNTELIVRSQWFALLHVEVITAHTPMNLLSRWSTAIDTGVFD
jgi:hypothetical protein